MQRLADNAQRRAAGQLDIAMHATIKGDARRIFTAMTVPEYREAWMCLPDPGPGSYVTAYQAADHYQLNFYRSGTLQATVTGQYQICRRHRLDFTWRDHRMLDYPESRVRVHIAGHFESSRLTLLHRDIFGEDYSRWLHHMWLASLDKLAALLYQRWQSMCADIDIRRSDTILRQASSRSARHVCVAGISYCFILAGCEYYRNAVPRPMTLKERNEGGEQCSLYHEISVSLFGS